MNIYFLRHGQTVTPGTYTGSTDVALSTRGIAQIHELSSYLRNSKLDFAYCSPLDRCRKSFDLLELPVSCSFEDSLREIDFGTWENRSFEHIYRQDRRNMQRWFDLKERFIFPGGDSISEFSFRVKDWFEKLKNQRYKNVLVVSHAGVIRHAITHLLGLEIKYADQFEICEGHVSLLSVDENFAVLKFLNRNS